MRRQRSDTQLTVMVPPAACRAALRAVGRGRAGATSTRGVRVAAVIDPSSNGYAAALGAALDQLGLTTLSRRAMNPRLDEIVLLTHQWDSMRAWWGTLLGVDPRTVGHGPQSSRQPGCGLSSSIPTCDERQSRSRWGYFTHGIGLLRDRCARHPHATRHDRLPPPPRPQMTLASAAVVCDPNGTDVAIRLPINADTNNRRGQEIDPDHIVTRLQTAADSAREVHANGE